MPFPDPKPVPLVLHPQSAPRAGGSRSARPLTVTEWSREWERWVVSARLADGWTLIGVFQQSEAAFQAADTAAERLAAGPSPDGSVGAAALTPAAAAAAGSPAQTNSTVSNMRGPPSSVRCTGQRPAT